MENNEQELNEKNEEHQPKGEIPAWLQGLDEPETEEAPSEKKEKKSVEDDWIKETEKPVPSPDLLPDAHQDTRINNVEESPINDQEYPPESEDFVEISDFMTSESEEKFPKSEDETLADNEELPDWLHEMIAEEPEPPLEESMPSTVDENGPLEEIATSDEATIDPDVEEHETDEPTEPVDITQETPVDQEEDIEESDIDDDEEIEAPGQPIDDVSPVPLTHEADKEDKIAEEEQGQEPGMPKMLRFAAFLLEQGDYDQAIDILNSYIDKPEFRGEIKGWLQNVINNGAKNNSAVWEAFGDIAMNEGDSQQALEAYAKAIDILLEPTKGIHETR